METLWRVESQQGQSRTDRASPRVESDSNFHTSHCVPLVKPPSLASAMNSPWYSATHWRTRGSRMMREHMYASAIPVSPAPWARSYHLMRGSPTGCENMAQSVHEACLEDTWRTTAWIKQLDRSVICFLVQLIPPTAASRPDVLQGSSVGKIGTETSVRTRAMVPALRKLLRRTLPSRFTLFSTTRRFFSSFVSWLPMMRFPFLFLMPSEHLPHRTTDINKTPV